MKDGFEKARIIYADSGRLEMTADKQHLLSLIHISASKITTSSMILYFVRCE